jgi:hypothetical protein
VANGGSQSGSKFGMRPQSWQHRRIYVGSVSAGGNSLLIATAHEVR